MYSICLRYAKNKEDANDIFQQGFYLIYKNIKQLKNPDALSGWVKRIIVNAALEHGKKSNQLPTQDIDNAIHFNSNEVNKALNNLAVDELTQLIQELPEGCRKVFNLYVIDGIPHKDIAEQLNISLGTSKSQLHDARKILKQKITANNLINTNELISKHGE